MRNNERERLYYLFQESKCPAHFLDNKQILDTTDYLLANGVIVPPCKIGDTVYRISKRYGKWQILPRKVCSMTYSLDHLGLIKLYISTTTDDMLGETVFLTREEAEQKLREGE